MSGVPSSRSAHQNAPPSARFEVAGPDPKSFHCAPAQSWPAELPVVIVAVPAGELVDGVDVDVVLEVLADSRQVVHHLHPRAAELVRRPDSGEQQEPRRTDGPGGDDDLLGGRARPSLPPVPCRYSTPTARPLSMTMRVTRQSSVEVEVRPRERRLQIADGGAAPPRAPLGDLIEPASLLARAVEVRVVGDPGLLRGPHERLGEVVGADLVRHPERTARAVELVRKPLVVLGPAEVGKHAGVGPALAPSSRSQAS